MADIAKRDQNYVPANQGTSSADGISPTDMWTDPNDHHTLVKTLPTTNTSHTDFEGAPVTVGTTAVEVTFTGTTHSIKIQSSYDNTGIIYYGKSNVTNAGANAMGELAEGDAVIMDYNDSSNAIYVVSDTAAQTIYKKALI